MAEQQKILIITNYSRDLYHFRRELIAELAKTNKIVLVMPFQGNVEYFQTQGYKCIRVEVDRRGINPFTDLKLLRTYNRIIKVEKPDQVITYSIKPNIYGGFACIKSGVPYCANVQGLGSAFQKEWLAKFVTLLYRAALRKAKTVFFENKFNAHEFVKRRIIGKDRVAVLHGAGVNLEYFPYCPYPKGEEFHFLFLGRIMKEKGVDELFEAMVRLRKEYGCRVVLDVGGFFEEQYKEKIETLEENSVINYHGFIEDTRPYYARANCVVLPSYHEGMSNVLLEASATGRPVITSDIPGCRETLEDGKTGYLCGVKDAGQLYEKMKKMADMPEDEAERMGVAARERMEKLFDKRKVVKRTIDYLKIN